MKKNILAGLLLMVLIQSFAQSPTYQALLKLDHNVNNNKFNVAEGPKKEDFTQRKSAIWNNVYFKYFKNPAGPQPDAGMRFSVMRQCLYSIYCNADTILRVRVLRGKRDKFSVDAIVSVAEGGNIRSEKLKSREYTVVKEDSAVLVEVGRELIKPGSIVQILVEIESYNVRNLGPFNFTKPVFGNFDFILSTNIPEPFQYKIPDGIILEGASLGSMSLKEFTNATPPIVSYKVVSHSRTWIVPQNAGIENFTFPLTSLKFEKNVGITEKKLMSSK